MSNNPVKIVIVDDHEVLMESLATWLDSQPEFKVLGRAQDGASGLKLCLETHPDLVLVDVALPGGDGIELVERLQQELPALRALVMSGHQDHHTIWRISRSGAQGYLEKNAPLKLLKQAIKLVAAGGCFFSREFQKISQECQSDPEAFPNLVSKREQEVLKYVAQGWTDERIAEAMKISAGTIMVHRKNIRQKLRIHNDRDMMAYALKWGLGVDLASASLAAA